jgi:hypothetical protein
VEQNPSLQMELTVEKLIAILKEVKTLTLPQQIFLEGMQKIIMQTFSSQKTGHGYCSAFPNISQRVHYLLKAQEK